MSLFVWLGGVNNTDGKITCSAAPLSCPCFALFTFSLHDVLPRAHLRLRLRLVCCASRCILTSTPRFLPHLGLMRSTETNYFLPLELPEPPFVQKRGNFLITADVHSILLYENSCCHHFCVWLSFCSRKEWAKV